MIRRVAQRLSFDLDYYLSGYSLLFVDQFITLATGLATTWCFTNLAAKEVYGGYALIVSIASWLTMVTLPGVGQAIQRSSARGFDGAFMVGMRRRLTAGAVGSALMLVIALVFLFAGRTMLAGGALAASVLFPFVYAMDDFRGVLFGKQRVGVYVALHGVIQAAVAASTIVMLVLGWPLIAILAANMGARAMGHLAAVGLIRWKFLTNDKVDDEFHSFGWNLSLVGVVGGTSAQLDRIIVAGMLGLEAIAAYELAYRLTDPMRNLGVFLNKLLFPRVVRVSGAAVAGRFLSRIVPLVAGLTIIGIVGSLLFAPAMRWLFPKYPEAIPYAIWMFWSTLAAVILIYLETYYISQDRFQRTYYAAAAARSIGVIALLPFFIHWWGVFGAIWARFLVRGAQALALLVKLFFDRRLLEREELADATGDDEMVREASPCPLCGDGAGATIYRVPDRLSGKPGLFSLRRCASCGLVRQDPRVPLAAIGAHYPDDYAARRRETKRASGGERALRRRRDWLAWVAANRPGPRDIGWRRTFALWPARWSAWVRRGRDNPLAAPGKGRKMLDVGCGEGDFLQEMTALGWRAFGLEPHPATAEAARRRGLSVITGALPEQAAQLPGPFDAIALRTIVEHLPDPAALLHAARDLLAPGGVLVVQTVYHDGWAARLAGLHWAHWDQPRHYVLFTRAHLSALLRTCGWRPVAAYDRSSATSWLESLDNRLAAGPFGEWLGKFARRRWARVLTTLPAALVDRLGHGDAGTIIAVRDDAPAAGWAPREIRDTLIK